jgi:NTE family protein
VTTDLKADLVLSGGGVKGIGLSGATVALMEAGYAIQRVSGTSAGSVVGAILAVGADQLGPEQVEQITMTLPYRKFLDPTPITGIPLLGPAWGVLSETGIYKGDSPTIGSVLSWPASGCAPSAIWLSTTRTCRRNSATGWWSPHPT